MVFTSFPYHHLAPSIVESTPYESSLCFNCPCKSNDTSGSIQFQSHLRHAGPSFSSDANDFQLKRHSSLLQRSRKVLTRPCRPLSLKARLSLGFLLRMDPFDVALTRWTSTNPRRTELFPNVNQEEALPITKRRAKARTHLW